MRHVHAEEDAQTGVIRVFTIRIEGDKRQMNRSQTGVTKLESSRTDAKQTLTGKMLKRNT